MNGADVTLVQGLDIELEVSSSCRLISRYLQCTLCHLPSEMAVGVQAAASGVAHDAAKAATATATAATATSAAHAADAFRSDRRRAQSCRGMWSPIVINHR